MIKVFSVFILYIYLSLPVFSYANDITLVVKNESSLLLNASINSESIGLVSPGQMVELLDIKDRYFYIHLGKNKKGWVKENIFFHSDNLYSNLKVKIKALNEEKKLNKELQTNLIEQTNLAKKLILSLKNEKNKYQQERLRYLSIAKTYDDVEKVDSLNRDLQKKIITLSKKNDFLKIKNDILKESSTKNNFIFGGFLVLIAILIGYLLSIMTPPVLKNNYKKFNKM